MSKINVSKSNLVFARSTSTAHDRWNWNQDSCFVW